VQDDINFKTMDINKRKPLYDLTNDRYQSLTVKFKNGKTVIGQFVSFSIQKDNLSQNIPAANEYCLLLKDNLELKNKFWDTFKNYTFREMPKNVLIFKYDDIAEILIQWLPGFKE
jgi:hypothetical protein